MNLYRWVKGLGLTPRLMGNVKGLQDPYRNPTTQQGFAERWGQNAAMVTSFADGSFDARSPRATANRRVGVMNKPLDPQTLETVAQAFDSDFVIIPIASILPVKAIERL
jgi:hypothetical protein